jgi:hypothetical protein
MNWGEVYRGRRRRYRHAPIELSSHGEPYLGRVGVFITTIIIRRVHAKYGIRFMHRNGQGTIPKDAFRDHHPQITRIRTKTGAKCPSKIFWNFIKNMDL